MAVRWIDSDDEDADPLTGVANLFDLGIVFALGLMLAVTGQLDLSPTGDVTSSANGVPTPDDAMQELPRFRLSEETLSGRGERLGMAYRLPNGEVVYVPEQPKSAP